MVANGISSILGIFTSGLGAGFGELIAKDEKQTLKRAYLYTIKASTAQPFEELHPAVEYLIELSGNSSGAENDSLRAMPFTISDGRRFGAHLFLCPNLKKIEKTSSQMRYVKVQ